MCDPRNLSPAPYNPNIRTDFSNGSHIMIPRTPDLSTRKLMFPIALAASLLLWQGAPLADVYKWVNENNEIQYTQIPPPPGIHSTRVGPASPPAGAPDTITEPLQKQLDDNEADNKKQMDTAKLQQQQIEIRKMRQQNCITAHNNLEHLNRSGQIRYRTGEGKVLRLTEEDRAKRIEEANSQVKEFCDN